MFASKYAKPWSTKQWEQDHSRAEARSPGRQKLEKARGPVCTQDLKKNVCRDSSTPLSPAAADRARLPAAALHPGSREVFGCKSRASALPQSGSSQVLARETRHSEVPGCLSTLLSFTHLCTSSGLLLGSWLHLWMT